MPVRVNHVKETFTPWRISWRLGLQPCRSERSVMFVCIINPENNSAPPAVLVSRAHGQVHECFAGLHAAKGRSFTAKRQHEPNLAVELNGTSHVPHGKCYCTDVLDHSRCPPRRFFFPGSLINSAGLENADYAEMDGFYRFPSFKTIERERCQQSTRHSLRTSLTAGLVIAMSTSFMTFGRFSATTRMWLDAGLRLDLSAYENVKERASETYARLADGSMPYLVNLSCRASAV
jgi:hypothetical protein